MDQQQYQSQQQNQNHHNESGTPSPIRKSGFFVYPESIVNEGVQACKKSILGKIIKEKPIHVSSIQKGLESIWGSPPGLKIQEIEGGILQFFMDRAIDQERILLGNPWIFRNSWLIVKSWDRQTDLNLVDFAKAPVWIQLWGLPPHCKTKKMGENIGNLLGQVEAAEVYEYPGKKRIIKIKVAINISQPIQTGILIGNARDGTTWIDFRYERLPQVCFKCGLLGHGDQLCQFEPLKQEESAPLGPWIRSNQYGKRILDDKDRKFHSNPSLSKSFGQYSPPIPPSMLAEMAAMKIREDTEEQNHNPSTSQQHRSQAAQTGDGKGVWHRANRGTVNTAQLMEINYNKEAIMVKRPRIDEEWVETTENQLAGPAEQASQRP
jgi:hypothetical protein